MEWSNGRTAPRPQNRSLDTSRLTGGQGYRSKGGPALWTRESAQAHLEGTHRRQGGPHERDRRRGHDGLRGRLASIGSAIHLGVQLAAAERRARRDEAVDSVTRLAYRLQDARADQREAEVRAVAAEARIEVVERALARAVAEAAALREALSVEREFSAGLRDIIGA